MSGSSCIKLSKEIEHSGKGLITTQNINENECFEWCFKNNPPTKIRKIGKDSRRELYFNNLKSSRQDYRYSASALVFFFLKTRKTIQSICQRILSRHVDLSLIGKDGKRHDALTKDFNTYTCMLIHYTVKENIFFVIVYRLLV